MAFGGGMSLSLARPGGLSLALSRKRNGTPPTPTAPAITSSSISGTPQDGQTLTAQRSVTGYPNPTITYQWQRNGVNIAGQTAQTILLNASTMSLVNADVISCEITATNGVGVPATAEPTIAFVAGATLQPLTVNNTVGTVGTPYTGTVSGKTAGSTLSLSGTGAAGLTVSGTSITGTPTTAGGVDIIETLAGATNTPRTTTGLITVAAAGASPAPTAPVLSNLSSGWAAGQNPPDWNTAFTGEYYNGNIGDAGYGEGDQLRVRWRLGGTGAFTTEAWVPFGLDLAMNGFQTRYAFYTNGSLNAGGLFEAYVDAIADLGLPTQSAISTSNKWQDTLSAVGAVTPNVYVAEGDSITAGFNNYVTLLDTEDATLTIYNVATGGQSLSHFVADLASTRAYDAQYASILAGANDQATYPNVRDQWIAPVRSDGAKVILIGGLPQNPATVPSHAAYLASYMAAAEAGYLAGEFDGFVDTRLSPMSVWNATNYGDYVHPTELGQTYLKVMFKAELNRLRGIANTPVFLALTNKSGVPASTLTTSDPFWLNGLGYGQTVAISVAGGEYRLNGGAWTTASGTSGNAKVEVRRTSAAAGSSAQVTFTAGGVDAVWTVGSVAGSSVLTTTYRSSAAGNGGFGANFTFSGVSFYAGENIVAISIATGATAPTAVSLGGTAGTKLAEIVGGSGGANRSVSFWKFSKGAGGSGSLVITHPSVYSIGYSLWSTDAGASFVASASADYQYRNDPIRTSTTIAIPSGGVVLIAAHSEVSGTTIVPESGTTEEAEFVDTGNWKFWAGRLASGNQPGITGLAFGGSQMLAVSLQP